MGLSPLQHSHHASIKMRCLQSALSASLLGAMALTGCATPNHSTFMSKPSQTAQVLDRKTSNNPQLSEWFLEHTRGR